MTATEVITKIKTNKPDVKNRPSTEQGGIVESVINKLKRTDQGAVITSVDNEVRVTVSWIGVEYNRERMQRMQLSEQNRSGSGPRPPPP